MASAASFASTLARNAAISVALVSISASFSPEIKELPSTLATYPVSCVSV